MTTTDDLQPLKLQGRAGLLSAVPVLLGFHPSDSLVLLCMSGPRHRVGPVMRVDTIDVGAHAHLAAQAEHYANEVAIVVYGRSFRRPELLEALMDDLLMLGVPIIDVMLVNGSQVRPAYPGPDDPDDIFPMPDASDPQRTALTAAAALRGRAVLADRTELARSIAGPAGAHRAAADRAVDIAAVELLSILEQRQVADPDPVTERLWSVLDHASEECLDGPLSLPTAARLAVLCSDIVARDALIVRLVTDDETQWLPVLIAAAAQIPDDAAMELCAVLSLHAYCRGDGALAQVALDRTMAVNPDHRLGQMMMSAMEHGMPPATLRRLANADGWPLSPGTDG